MGFKFFRDRESTKVKGIKAVRATYLDPDHNEVHVTFRSEDKRLPDFTLELTPDQAGELVQHLMSAYEAIRPPIQRGWGASTWQGMD